MKKIITIEAKEDGKIYATNIENLCDCADCQGAEKPCSMDCDKESECLGCKLSREEGEEIEFEIAKAFGKI